MPQQSQPSSLQDQIDLLKLADEERKAKQELVLRERELQLKSEELGLRKREFDLKEQEQKYSRWLNPVFLGLIAASLTLLGNIYVNRSQATFTREQAKFKAQSDLVLEAIKTGDPVKAANNLDAFVKLGYIDDPEGKIHAFLAMTDQSNFPVLPTAGGISPASNVGIFRRVDQFGPASRERELAKSVGRLDIDAVGHVLSSCTAWVVAKAIVMTADYCLNEKSVALSFEIDTTQGPRFEVEPTPLEINSAAGYALLRLRGDAPKSLYPLPLARRRPKIGEPILLIHYPGGQSATVSESPDCKIVAFTADKLGDFQHTCATIFGSSGAPIISAVDYAVIGIHRGKSSIDSADLVNHGESIDSILASSTVLQKLLAPH